MLHKLKYKIIKDFLNLSAKFRFPLISKIKLDFGFVNLLTMRRKKIKVDPNTQTFGRK